MTKKILLENGTHSLTRFSGEIYRVGSGRDISVESGLGGSVWPSIQIRGDDGRLDEIKLVIVSDYLDSYLRPGESGLYYFRQMRFRGKILNFLVAVKTDEIALYDEKGTNNNAYPRSTMYFAIGLLISLPFSLFTLMLLSPISAILAFKLFSRSFYQGSIPSHKVIARQVKQSLTDEGFAVI